MLGALPFKGVFSVGGASVLHLMPQYLNTSLQAAGLGDSLFRRLAGAHPSARVSLTFQFRMNAPIMELSNRVTYGGQLRAGNAAVATACLHLPHKAVVCC